MSIQLSPLESPYQGRGLIPAIIAAMTQKHRDENTRQLVQKEHENELETEQKKSELLIAQGREQTLNAIKLANSNAGNDIAKALGVPATLADGSVNPDFIQATHDAATTSHGQAILAQAAQKDPFVVKSFVDKAVADNEAQRGVNIKNTQLVAPFGSEGTQSDLNTGKRTNVAGGTTEQTTIPNVMTTPQGPIQIGQNVVTKNLAGSVQNQVPVANFAKQDALLNKDAAPASGVQTQPIPADANPADAPLNPSGISTTPPPSGNGMDMSSLSYLLQIAKAKQLAQQQQTVANTSPLTGPLINRNAVALQPAY